MAGPRFGIFGRDAACGIGRRRELFLERCARFAGNSLAALVRRDFQDRYFRLALWIVLATIPIGIAGLSLAKAAEHLQFAAARPQRDRLGLRRDGRPARDRRTACAAPRTIDNVRRSMRCWSGSPRSAP